MACFSKWKWCVAVIASQVVATHSAMGQVVEFSGDVTVMSDYMFRGVSQTMSAPALQGSLTVEHESGLYGYLWASTVDFTESPDPDDGVSLEVDLELGYFHQISDRAAVSVAWTRYFFPNINPGLEYDYDEWLGTLLVDERHGLNVGYSRDVFAEGLPGVFYAVTSGFDLTEKTGIDLELGYYDLDRAYDTSYGYAEIALVGSAQFLDWRLSYFSVSDEAADVFYTSTVSDRVVLTLGIEF